jgi:uncharacterized membrane protein
MNLEKKLAQWQEAGVIDADTRARIEGFEHGRQHPVLLYALGGLGALTLGTGIVSVVAANWDAIGKVQKLAADLLLGGALAAALYWSARREQAWLSDVLAAVYYAFVLASIALLGQVYQLGAPTYQALLTWSLCTAPFMLLARSPLVAAVWLCGLVGTQGVSIDAWLDTLRKGSGGNALANNLGATLAFASTLMWLSLARAPWLVRERPLLSDTWTRMLWGAVLAAGLAAGFLFYEHPSGSQLLTWSLGACGVVVATLHVSLPRLYPHWSAQAYAGHRLLVACIWLLLAAAAGQSHGEAAWLGAIAQVVLLGIAAFSVLALGQLRVFNLLTAAIALRVLVMYFEVFGSMLDTGLGMISGGILTLLLAWLWKRKSPELAQRLGRIGG